MSRAAAAKTVDAVSAMAVFAVSRIVAVFVISLGAWLGAWLGIGLVLGGAASRAHAQEAEDGPTGFRVQRIELSFYAGLVGGTTYLELPILGTRLTNDTALDQVLDYSGRAPSTPVQAPKKALESGWKSGGSATFYASPNFGLALFGEYGQQEAVFTGRREIDEVLQLERTEIDRTTMSTFAGGTQIVYHVGRERKYPVRPILTLGFGGILNSFPDADDIGALYLTYGIGVGFPIKGSFRGSVGFDSRIYTWETEEVALDSTLQFPALTIGLTWRHIVPEDAEASTGERF